MMLELMRKDLQDTPIPDFPSQAIELGYKIGYKRVLKEVEEVFTADYPSIFMATQAMRDKINELKNE